MKKGTTLIELMVVLGLISIIVVIGSSYTGVSKRILVLAELEKLYSVFIILQRNAMLERKEQELVFTTDSNSYCFNGRLINLGSFLKLGTAIDAKGTPSNPQNIITKACSFIDNKVIFYADGRVSSGVIYLTDKDGTLTCAISVPVSDFPYIRRYIYRTNSWALIT